jgi:hypothetical protein
MIHISLYFGTELGTSKAGSLHQNCFIVIKIYVVRNSYPNIRIRKLCIGQYLECCTM